MKADHLSYQRATTVSLLGLALQIVMGVSMLIYSVVARPADHVAMTIALFVLLGSIVWLTLAIVFDQHRRERIEAMETEALFGADGTREGSVFNEKVDDVRINAARLSWMHRVLVPIVSLVYAFAVAGIAVWRLNSGKAYLPQVKEDLPLAASVSGWAIGLGLGLALVGFFFARYAAGMAKQPVWRNLRAGAAASVGAAVLGLVYAVAQGIDYGSTDAVIRYLHVIVPGFMIVIAVEVVLNFLLGLYSPRRPGEYPNAAFDSRILGFAAAPDRIAKSIGEAVNYQFGFDVTSSWFYQLLSRSLALLVLIGLGVIWLLTCVAMVQPHEQGLRVRLGEKIGTTLQPGIYFKLPWPFERIDREAATTARRIDLGGLQPKLQNSKAILWTNDHGTQEVYFAVQPPGAERSIAAAGGATDLALVSVELPLYYQITDLDRFESFASADQREGILAGIAKREAARVLASEDMDRVLGNGRSEISRKIREGVQREFAALNGGKGVGVNVLFIGIEGVHPPRDNDTAKAFEQLVQANQDRASARLAAETEANEKLIEVAGSVEKAQAIVTAINELQTIKDRQAASKSAADAQTQQDLTRRELAIQDLLVNAGGSAAAAIQAARSDRWTRHMQARSQSEAYVGQTAGYKAAPQVYAAQRYFQTIREAMSKSRVYIVSGDNVEIRPDLSEQTTGGNMLLRPKQPE
jgi:membrane protease subunit HflK